MKNIKSKMQSFDWVRYAAILLFIGVTYLANAQCALCPPDDGGGGGTGDGNGGGEGIDDGGGGDGGDGDIGSGIVVTLTGNSSVAVGSEWDYTVQISQDPLGTHASSAYEVSSGGTIVSESLNSVRVRWDLAGNGQQRWIKVNANIFSANYHSAKKYVVVWQPLKPGIIQSEPYLCQGSVPERITNTQLSSGGTVPATYQWLKYTGNSSDTDFVDSYGFLTRPENWIEAEGTNDREYYDPSEINSKTTYIRRATSAHEVKHSNAVTITPVASSLNPGALTYQFEELHPGQIPSTIIGSPASLGVRFEWLKREVGEAVFSPILKDDGEVENSVDYSPGALFKTTTYIRRAYLDVCGLIEDSTPLTIEVLKYNYVWTRMFQEAFDRSSIDNATEDQLIESVTYFDGLGRSDQQVNIRFSPNGNDLVTPSTYDAYSRKEKAYLPFVASTSGGQYKPNALNDDHTLSDQYNFYLNFGSKATEKAYAQTIFENSPLSRVFEQGSYGEDWQPGKSYGSVRYRYHANETDEVRNLNRQNILTAEASFYSSGDLMGSTMIDEDGNETIEYVDLEGRTVLKKSRINDEAWAKTAYVYDDLGLLAFVLPPEAMARLDDEFYSTGADRITFLDRWAFQYSYDHRGRMISKKVPGAERVLMVYDRWDRLILTQDGNQRRFSQWLFTKYDALDRPIVTGIINGGDEATERNLVAISNEQFETFDASGPNQYSNRAYPQDDKVASYLTVTYYDNYNYLEHADWMEKGFGFSDPEITRTENHSVKGQITGSMTKTGDDQWIFGTSYYDDKYRAIQTFSSNHLNGVDVTTNYFDFVGRAEKNILSHTVANKTITITRTFNYDQQGRLLEVYHQLGSEPPVLLSSNQYSVLGELEKKGLHESNGVFAQSIDYKYNIRGWLKSINELGLSGNPPNSENDLFSMELIYNELINEISNLR